MGIKRHLEENFDYEIVDEFLDHLSLMLDTIDALIIDLHRSELYSRNVKELFRVFHNIKSATGYLKLDMMTRLSKLVENELEAMRECEGPASKESIDWLISIADQFKRWKDDIDFDKDSFSKIEFKILKIPDMER
jgi:chemotaxis protein histidine kinase CheA